MGRVIDIRRYMGGGGAPPSMVEIEYLQSDGNQWIDLGIYGSNDLDFTIDFEPLDLTETNRTWTGTGSYFGSIGGSGQHFALVGYNRSTTNKGCFFYAGFAEAQGYTRQMGLTSARCTIIKKGNTIIIPNGSTVSVSGTYTTPVTLALFANKKASNNTVEHISKMKLYSLKFIKNNEVILDLIPVRIGQVGYLYDRVSGRLFDNNGTGNFILGQDVSVGSYIQDGLIALYDGKNNVGVGIHDATATSWLNLANTSESITGIDNTFTWGDDYLLPPVVKGVGVIPSYKPLTIECVFQDVGTGAYIPLNLEVYWFGIRANDTINFKNTGYYVTLLSRIAKNSISGIMNNANTAENPKAIFLNGVSSMVSQAGMNWSNQKNVFNGVSFNYGTGTFKFFCIRLYNRQLTEAEVLANYNIDKIRFGLT